MSRELLVSNGLCEIEGTLDLGFMVLEIDFALAEFVLLHKTMKRRSTTFLSVLNRGSFRSAVSIGVLSSSGRITDSQLRHSDFASGAAELEVEGHTSLILKGNRIKHAVEIGNRFNAPQSLDYAADWNTFKGETLKTARLTVGFCPRSGGSSVLAETLAIVNESRAARLAGSEGGAES